MLAVAFLSWVSESLGQLSQISLSIRSEWSVSENKVGCESPRKERGTNEEGGRVLGDLPPAETPLGFRRARWGSQSLLPPMGESEAAKEGASLRLLHRLESWAPQHSSLAAQISDPY